MVNATSDSAAVLAKGKTQSAVASSTNVEELSSPSQKNNEQRPEKADEHDRPLNPSCEDVKTAPLAREAQDSQAQGSQSTWLGWLARRDVTTPALTGAQGQRPAQSEMTPTPTTALSTDENVSAQPPRDEQSNEGLYANNKRSWYYMWSGDTSSVSTKEEGAGSEVAPPTATGSPELVKRQIKSLEIPTVGTPQSKSTSQASSLQTAPPPPLREDGTKSSGWVFWSRDKKNRSSMEKDEPHIGEIAVSDTPSQTKPRRASISVSDESARPVVEPSLQEVQAKNAHVQKAVITQQALEKQQQVSRGSKSEKPTTASIARPSTNAESPNAAASARPPVEIGTPRTASPAPSKSESPNLLLPPIKETLSFEETPSILQQLARLLYYTKEPELKHLSLVKDPPRIKNALAIGVHGYFPAPLIRTVLGQPTGTSIKFADMAANCIKKWTRSHGYDCEVKSAALEGEGRIAERVELLWKLLLNWIDEIRRSDFVMIACHSQGVPVAIMLVAKLLQFGCISAARVGICAMAGVNMGPFQDYKSRWISGSAGELFEFSDPNSKVSRDYAAALDEVLKSGAIKLTFVGSIDDQLVSMESSIFAPLSHPHIYRAVFIDSRIHAPNFLSHLVGFALKLRNVGVPDHGLIKELSSPLAGSLYGGEGHSRIYEDEAVYDIAISFALETNALKDVPVSRRPTSNNGANPYILPFAMRGILEEDYVKQELQDEARVLLAQFDDWKPTTKALKDVKFRLEGIRSKL